MPKLIKTLCIIALMALPSALHSQFYNGHQMNFGKNRVQYSEFEWLYFRYKQFDTYFYLGGNDNAILVAKLANKNIPEIEKFFDNKINQRLIFVIYNSLSDFKQSNIGLNTGDANYNIGGVTRIVDNIVFLYVDGDLHNIEKQVRGAIAEVILNEMLYGTEIANKVANNTLISVPNWFFYGLISYVAEKWNYEIDNRVRDGILTGHFEDFNHLTGEDAIYAGHSIWYYLATNYGEHIISTIIYLTRVTKNVENGFQYVLGTGLKMMTFDWLQFYQTVYAEHESTCDNLPLKNIFPKRFKNWEVIDASISKNGKYIAYTMVNLGKYKIFIYEIEKNKNKRILTREHKLEQIVDKTFPILAWHPTSKLLGYIIEKQGKIFYCAYNLDEKKIKEFELAGLNKVFSFDYSDDGLKLVLAANANGTNDIYVFNILANILTNLTADNADDYNPKFINNSKEIIFASNRKTDTLSSGKNYIVETQACSDIFIMDASGKSDVLTRVTNTPDINEQLPTGLSKNKYMFLANQNGLFNRYEASIDSTISFIDTTTHYRYYTKSKPLTNLPRNILKYDIDKTNKTIIDVIFKDKRWGIYQSNYESATESTLIDTKYRRANRETINYKSDIQPIAKKPETNIPKENIIDINNYSFSEEAIKSGEKGIQEFDSLGNPLEKRRNMYFTTFFTNYIANQIDFGFLNSSYQPFTGSAFYFNPGFNILFKLGVKDLFENYRITGGVRFSGNFDSNEYLLSFEDLKYRWDKQYIFHRLAIHTSDGTNLIKSHSHELLYITRYPFSQVDAIQFTASIRQDRLTTLSLDYISLLADPEYNYWIGAKTEYIFDNTRKKQLNIYYGLRYKLFGEYYHQLDKKQSELIVFGGDFRYYLPIHRNLILATRLAGSGSFGRSKLIYYLGGIDNWINFSSRTPTFDSSVRINPDANYVYQAVATNMRGFSQNIRNGSNFAVVNAEIRWPIVSYIVNRPLNSAFLENLQLIGFFDIGSAWSGFNPFSGNNAFDKDVYNNYPITIIIDNNNYPIVAGYGFGIRSKLFGYFIRADWAWGIENNNILPRIFYLSLNLDF